MVNDTIGTLKELKLRVMPALKSKVRELKGKNITFISEDDIWNCLKNKKWLKENDLTLYDIVNDILFIKDNELLTYKNEKQQIETDKFEKQEENKPKEEDTIL